SSAGSPAAQAAMLAALDLPSVRANASGFGRLVERLGFVVKPEGGTLAYVASLYDSEYLRARPDAREAAALTLGAAVAHASRAGDKGAAQRHNARLRAERASADAKARPAAILALGNTVLRENVPLLRQYARDERGEVREAVAHALRDVDAPEVRATLL